MCISWIFKASNLAIMFKSIACARGGNRKFCMCCTLDVTHDLGHKLMPFSMNEICIANSKDRALVCVVEVAPRNFQKYALKFKMQLSISSVPVNARLALRIKTICDSIHLTSKLLHLAREF